ncbi:hypothetical protein HI914_05184 [Erysiphe necator]|nr:hypothetical protein HI914_05184 [Erysiphe necator]
MSDLLSNMLSLRYLIRLVIIATLGFFVKTNSHAYPVEPRKSDKRPNIAQRSPARPIFQGADLAIVVSTMLGQNGLQNLKNNVA